MTASASSTLPRGRQFWPFRHVDGESLPQVEHLDAGCVEHVDHLTARQRLAELIGQQPDDTGRPEKAAPADKSRPRITVSWSVSSSDNAFTLMRCPGSAASGMILPALILTSVTLRSAIAIGICPAMRPVMS